MTPEKKSFRPQCVNDYDGIVGKTSQNLLSIPFQSSDVASPVDDRLLHTPTNATHFEVIWTLEQTRLKPAQVVSNPYSPALSARTTERARRQTRPLAARQGPCVDIGMHWTHRVNMVLGHWRRRQGLDCSHMLIMISDGITAEFQTWFTTTSFTIQTA